MAWTDRLRSTAKFVSPSGLEFTPLWRGNDISAEKRLGRHAYPNIDKEVVQDMGMNSRGIPLTVYFDGPDHDKESADFEKALYEPGAWQVTHPVYGLMRLQLVSYKMSVEPVDSGNATEFETEWIEPAEDVSAVSDIGADVENAVKKTKWTAIKDTVNLAKNTVTKMTGAVKKTIQFVNARITAVHAQINELTTGTYMDIAAIAGSVVELIEVPDLMLKSLSSKIAMFASLGQRIITDLPNAATHTANTVNAALTGQLFLNAITAAMAQTIISDMPETRREALSVLSEYRRFTSGAQAALDRAAALTAHNRIEDQYIARASSGEAIAALNAAVARYLIGSFQSLKIERRVVLDRPRAPLEIAVTEYKASGEQADYFYELFCRTNALHGRELLLLPAGREVVIYG